MIHAHKNVKIISRISKLTNFCSDAFLNMKLHYNIDKTFKNISRKFHTSGKNLTKMVS